MELVHRGEHHGLPHRATTHGRVANVGHDDAGLGVDALVERRALSDRGGAADDRVVRHRAERGEEGVHRAAHATVEAVAAGEDLGERAEQDEVLGQTDLALEGQALGVTQGVTVEERLHDVGQAGLHRLVGL